MPDKLHIIPPVRLSRLDKHEMLSLLDVESEERPSKFFSTSHLRLISLALAAAKKHLLHTGVRRFCSASAARYDCKYWQDDMLTRWLDLCLVACAA
jgi:hypothetical protein